MEAASRTKLNFTGYDQNPAEFDFLEANRAGVAGSFPLFNKNRPPEYASTLSSYAPRVVTGKTAFSPPPKAKQTMFGRQVRSKYNKQKKITGQFGWADNFPDARGMTYALGAWLIFGALYWMYA